MDLEAIASKALAGARIDRAEALELYRRAPTPRLGRLADHIRAHNTRVSATDVRELVSIAIERTSAIGLLVKMATDATGPADAIARSGTIRYGPPRRYSIEGMRPTSIAFSCSSRAHSDGMS